MQNQEDGTEDEASAIEAEYSGEEMEEDVEKMSGWESLPHVCLRQVFSFLPDLDRRSAALVCHHWHNIMRSPSLWRTRFFHFNGRLSKFRPSEYRSAVRYARSLGVYLESLEVHVHPPRKSLVAQRLERCITGLFSELLRVQAPLRSLSLVQLHLDRVTWTPVLRTSLVDCLIFFLRRGASKLTSLCLNGMRNSLSQGRKLLFALTYSQRSSNRCCISSLELNGFFSTAVLVHRSPSVPNAMAYLQGLTNLSLSYSWLTDELLMALQHNSRRDGITLQTISLHCTWNEYHEQLICGDSWATLVSSCPDLKVKLTVDRVIDTDQLSKILLPEIPLRQYSMAGFYPPDQHWSAKPLLCAMLPRYRHSLQYLTLDLSNCNESLDDELLELVKVCHQLLRVSVWAFLEINTVERLLQIGLSQRTSLNKIKVRIYAVNDDTSAQEDQLEEMLSNYPQLPPQLEFFANIFPVE